MHKAPWFEFSVVGDLGTQILNLKKQLRVNSHSQLIRWNWIGNRSNAEGFCLNLQLIKIIDISLSKSHKSISHVSTKLTVHCFRPGLGIEKHSWVVVAMQSSGPSQGPHSHLFTPPRMLPHWAAAFLFYFAFMVCVSEMSLTTGSCIDEERRKPIYPVRIAEFSESLSLWTQIVLQTHPQKHVCLSVYSPTCVSPFLWGRCPLKWQWKCSPTAVGQVCSRGGQSINSEDGAICHLMLVLLLLLLFMAFF